MTAIPEPRLRSGIARQSRGCEHRYAALLRAARAPAPPAARRQRLSPLSAVGAGARARHPAGARRRLHGRGLARVFKQRDAGGAPCREVFRIATARAPGARRTDRRTVGAAHSNSGESIGDWEERLAATPAGRRAGLLDGLAAESSDRPALGSRRRGRAPGSEDVSRRYRARAGALAVNAPASARGSPSFGAGSRPRSDISSG